MDDLTPVGGDVVGDGSYRYSARDWARLPEGWTIGDVGGVAIDSRRNVHVFHRGEHPMLVFDPDGRFLRSWGEGLFTRPHGLHIGPDDSVWCTDEGAHAVRKFSPDGRLLMTIGLPGTGSPHMSLRPFNRCTHTALSPTGEIYVSDGYGNACVHKFSPDGKLLRTWGRPGIGPGEFNVPHNLCCDADGWVYVADRENHRVQVFDGDGRFETEWHHLHRPCALCMQGDRRPLFYVGEVAPGFAINRTTPNLGPRISVVDAEGRIVERVGRARAGLALDEFIAPHGMAVDVNGDLYVGEVSAAAWPEAFPDRPLPAKLRTFRKLVRQPSPA